MFCLMFGLALAQEELPNEGGGEELPPPVAAMVVEADREQILLSESVELNVQGLTPLQEITLLAINPLEEEESFSLQAREDGSLFFSHRPEMVGQWLYRIRDQDGPDLRLSVLQTLSAEASVRFHLHEASLQAQRGETLLWRFDIPSGSGGGEILLEHPNTLYLALGNSLLAIDSSTGKVLKRWLLAAPATRLIPAGAGGFLVELRFSDGSTPKLLLEQGRTSQMLPFDGDEKLFSWLANEAVLDDLEARLQQDTSNPWVFMRLSQQTQDSTVQRDLLRQALSQGQGFYNLMELSNLAIEQGFEDIAEEAYQAALGDFHARGYDARWLFSSEAQRRFSFPLAQLEKQLAAQNVAAADFWVHKLLELPITSEAHIDLVADYQELLLVSGRPLQAQRWQAYLAQYQRGVTPLVRTVAANAWRLLGALVLAMFLLHLCFVQKYWAPHQERLLKQLKNSRVSVFERFFIIRYFNIFEKLSAVFLLACVFLLMLSASWHLDQQRLDDYSFEGRLEPTELSRLASELTQHNAQAAFIRGLAAQVTGQEDSAKIHYEQALPNVKAAHNLAVLGQDAPTSNSAILSTLAEEHQLAEAAYNLDRLAADDYLQRAAFSKPALSYFDKEELRLALAGTWQEHALSVLGQPWFYLMRLQPPSLSTWQWQTILALYALLCAITFLALLLPRPKGARAAPRTTPFLILALLIPGAALCAELWGAAVLVLWAFVLADNLSEWLGWRDLLGVSFQQSWWILLALYLGNMMAVLLEASTHNRRLAEHRSRQSAALMQHRTRPNLIVEESFD